MNAVNSQLLRVEKLCKAFPVKSGLLKQFNFKNGRVERHRESVRAVNGIDLEISKGEALCLVGESGCGKSTVARTIMGLTKPSSGKVYYDGQRIDLLSHTDLMPFRRRMQMIFQNPYASLNPRLSVQKALEEPIFFHNPGITKAETAERIAHVMESVGVDPGWGDRFPHEFSGGQRQRISIARALTVDPEFIVADEPISALDVSIQAQILNLMMEAREKHSLTYLFITHDLSVVEHFGTAVAVMYLGALCEVSPTQKLFSRPRHPYTQALLSAIPRLDEERPNYIKLKGEIPTPIHLPDGCVFHSRCAHANLRCQREIPKLIDVESGVRVACHAIEEGRLAT